MIGSGFQSRPSTGWADGYSKAVFRLMDNLSTPRMGLIGPWGHKYPHQGRPGPAIDFLSEALRWWDRWLKDIESGIEQEPCCAPGCRTARPRTLGGALVFDSKTLTAPIEILGSPVVTFRVKSDRPVAMLAVRLSEVRQNEETTRITYGLLNLTHRNSHEQPEPLKPGKF